MYSFKQFLIEVYHGLFDTYKSKFEVHKNPSGGEAMKIMHDSEYKELRAILHENDAYVWDAAKGLHADVIHGLKKEQLPINGMNHHRLLIRSDKKEIDHDYYENTEYDRKSRESIVNHPWIKRYFSDYNLR